MRLEGLLQKGKGDALLGCMNCDGVIRCVTTDGCVSKQWCNTPLACVCICRLSSAGVRDKLLCARIVLFLVCRSMVCVEQHC
jgi:hypothetical protein